MCGISLKPIAPLFVAGLALLAAGLALGVKDEDADKPVKGGGLLPERVGMKNREGVQIAAVVAAIALIILGVLNGSARDVLYKAIAICSECIGLG